MMNGYDMTGWGWLLMSLWWVLVLAGIVALVWVVWNRGRPEPSSARRILDEKFASGEISPEEYQSRRRLIG